MTLVIVIFAIGGLYAIVEQVLEHRERMRALGERRALLADPHLYTATVVELAVQGVLVAQGTELEHAEAIAEAVSGELAGGFVHDGRDWRNLDDLDRLERDRAHRAA